MKKKLQYNAPEMEVVRVALSAGILSISGEQATNALGNSRIDDMTDYDSGSVVSW